MACKDLFRRKLLAISEGLSDEDLSHMVFLCGDVLTRQEIDNINTGSDLFLLLEERRKLDPRNIHYLAELLQTVGQDCLLDHLDREVCGAKSYRSQLRLSRLYVKDIGMELDDKDFQQLKSACGCNKEEITQYYHLIRYLEYGRKINIKHKVDVEFLQEALKKAGLMDDKDSKLCRIVEEYQKELAYEDSCYRMTSVPKGLCVIINNVKFSTPRHGSNNDRDLLKRLFTQFKFEVRVFNDLTSGQIKAELSEIAAADHWLYDCFICCVLSHGSLGRVFGVDNIAVRIQHILNLFSVQNCPSLAEKPKVFFLQVCQGQKNQTGSYASLPLERGLQVERRSAAPEIESDSEVDDVAPSPSELEPDLLLGYATPPGYKSYRDVTKGSWYINELVDSLQQHAAREDVLSILTKVNNDVALKDGTEGDVFVKQIPYPTFTLKKKLYLTNLADLQ